MTTYAQIEDVEDFFGIGPFGPETEPTSWTIEDMILAAEDFIDSRTRTSWRANVITAEQRDYSNNGMKLRQAPIRSVEAVRILDGANVSTLAQGRGNDYFFDSQNGLIYVTAWAWVPSVYSRWGFIRGKGRFKLPVEVDYTWGRVYATQGEEHEVREATLKRVGTQLLSTMNYRDLFPSGTEHVNYEAQLKEWKDSVDEFIRYHKRLGGW